ncbi:MAG: GTPase Era [Burkholderiaceae bacterium]
MVAIIGRPNVGKSTLMNRLIGQKLSITSRRPQTTRHRIAGVMTSGRAQAVFIDSPGFQQRNGGPLNRVLNRTAQQVAQDADVVLLVIDGARWTEADARAAALLPAGKTAMLVLNKIDAAPDKAKLMRIVQQAQQVRAFDEVVPVSARTGKQVDLLMRLCAERLPVAPPMFGEDELTDRSERFLAAELIREKLFRQLGDELPYDCTVVIDQYEEKPGLRRIHASILVDRDAQKPIVIGAGGERLKRIGTQAREDLERLTGGRVYLELFVKVRSGWADSEKSLRAYGYE